MGSKSTGAIRRRVLFVFGTRPEAIKMAPLIQEMTAREEFEVKICITSQHREMLDQVMTFFGLTADYDLDLMKPGQSLLDVVAGVVVGMDKVITESMPDIIIVQGDTNTVLAGALAAFYKKIPIAHLEAGLRSGDMGSPFPEEGNRIMVSRIANWHFAPTIGAAENLSREGITAGVVVVGNTVIDALLLGLEKIKTQGEDGFHRLFGAVDFQKRVILVTGHRRENFGEPLENICRALKEIITTFEDVEIIFPVHLNPNVREPVYRILSAIPRVHLIEPLDYPELIWLMRKSYLIMTDSGGIQEEAPTLGKPVLVMRGVTERQEGVDAGTAILVGTDQSRIVREVSTLLENQQAYQTMAKAVNPYGDGNSSKRIADLISREHY